MEPVGRNALIDCRALKDRQHPLRSATFPSLQYEALEVRHNAAFGNKQELSMSLKAELRARLAIGDTSATSKREAEAFTPTA